MHRDDFDYWEVRFETEADLQAAYAVLPISAQSGPHVALVEDDRMGEDEIRQALRTMADGNVSFSISPSEATKDEMWPVWPEDPDTEDGDDEDSLAP